ncbi:Mitoregulin [Manis javanica]|nr:Mitoregulin [Manis javanica]
MPDVSERTLQVSVLLAFASGVLVGWQANRLRRRYLDWRKRRLQDKLAMTQKKLDLARARLLLECRMLKMDGQHWTEIISPCTL